METRVCSDCGDELPLTTEYFHRASDPRYFHGRCIPCFREDARRRYRKTTYGTDQATFEHILAIQEGACILCERVVDQLYVDHDHETGMVRALLCHNCNTALGHFRDDPELLLRAAQYIVRTRRLAAA